MDIYAGKKTYAKNLLKEAAVAVSLGKQWLDVSAHRASRRRSCKGAQISYGGSLRHSKGRKASHGRTCATVSRLRTTSGGSRRGTVTASRKRSSITGQQNWRDPS